MVLWIRIHLPMQGTHVQYLVQEDSTSCRATKPISRNYWACMPELKKHTHPRDRALQQKKPPQWEAQIPQLRSLHALGPMSHNWWALVLQLLKPTCPRASKPQPPSLHAATTEDHMPRACALQPEKSPQWEAHAPQVESNPTLCN